MEPNGMYSSMQPGNMLGLEMSLHHPRPAHNPQNSQHIQQQQQNPPHPMVGYGRQDGDYYPQTRQQGYPFAAKSKNQSLTLSDDDEPGVTAETSADDGKRRMSPWQRMKWTDSMIRLLIMVVYYVGDEVGSEGNDPAGKKKGGGGALQKKGKWKSVSQVMTEKGFNVSPQQCEDKFNDLNKRYKRVNDILGKGTACRVVENPSLLDAMDHLSPKMKEEVRKLLNSKHLFFREMCAYHNSCGHGSGASVSGVGGVENSPPEGAAEPSQSQLQSRQQRCLHSTGNAPFTPNLNRGENEASKLAKMTSDEDDEEEDEEEEEESGAGSESHGTDERAMRKRKGTYHSPLIQQLDAELVNVLQDGRKSPFEKRQWMKTKRALLEEERVGIQYQGLELEKQRLKWLKFSSKKEREMEREKLVNERLKLENERMVLFIRQQELDLLGHDHHHQQQSSNKKSDHLPFLEFNRTVD
ncbi:hypothetical protein Salat_1013500 [Sesamum alatum]|uniref:Myb/SANT-like DNA-binding domain-containing protein n=1 Tax=Sesamum alatum TaxID=300844 RepID=A0AAE2CSG7_9LAMI|nr:hypothetical protein Salat_1013500 [Sesamum alatum]